MEEPVFIHTDAQAIIDAMIADYEAMTGKILQPGHADRLLINAFAYREQLVRTQINEASKFNLVSFSRAPFLDYLGELVGVRRLTATNSVCSLLLSLVPGHGALVIPAGVRVQSIDGKVVFALDEDVNVAANVDTVQVTATSLTEGEDGNGYAPGSISIILDPQPYLLAASNVDETAGGALTESDAELRERIKLAPQSFSNAGSIGAYKYYAKSANPGIVDVSITSPVPGEVHIFPLMEHGELPNSVVLDQVFTACNAERVRPLTDTVIVQSPTEIIYSLDVELTLKTGAIPTTALSTATKVLQEYADSRKVRCGLDVVLTQIIQKVMTDPNLYSVKVLDPMADVVVDPNQVAKCDSINVTIHGYSDE